MKYDMKPYMNWCNTPAPGGAVRRDSGPRRIIYKLGFSAGRSSCQEILDSYRADLMHTRTQMLACWNHIRAGRELLCKLAAAADGAALAGELIPDELNDAVCLWVGATPWMPVMESPNTGADQATCTQYVQVGAGTDEP